MKYIGYHRTSTKQQHLDRGINEITKFCKEHHYQLYRNKVYADQQTGTNFDRQAYQIIKELLEPGDALIITEMDRLGRNKKETMREIQYYRDYGVRLMVLELPTTLMDLSLMDNEMAKMMMETINNMMVELYVSIAEAEMRKRKKRQTEGIQEMKKRGEWDKYGRRKVLTLENFIEQYRNILQEEKQYRINQKLEYKNIKIKPLTAREICSRIVTESKKNPKMCMTTFYTYKKLAEDSGVNLDEGYTDLFFNVLEYNETKYAEFVTMYPKLLKEKQRRASNQKLKSITSKEMMDTLNLSTGTFYRYKQRYERELLIENK